MWGRCRLIGDAKAEIGLPKTQAATTSRNNTIHWRVVFMARESRRWCSSVVTVVT